MCGVPSANFPAGDSRQDGAGVPREVRRQAVRAARAGDDADKHRPAALPCIRHIWWETSSRTRLDSSMPDCRYKESELNVGENSCIDRCASKYWQVRSEASVCSSYSRGTLWNVERHSALQQTCFHHPSHLQ
jgi:Tim10/DDP family zinc finger